jgi:hypothetical protein
MYLAKLMRTSAFHLVTPVGRVNAAVLSVLRTFPSVFDDEFVGQWNLAAWNHEDTAGSSLHLGVAFVAACIVLVARGGGGGRPLRAYAAVLLGSYGLLTLMIDEDAVFALRFQLPFFVLAGPVVGVAATRFERYAFVRFLPWVFLVAAIPWVLFNNTRPLIGWTPWPTRVGSVLTTDPVEVLFAADLRLLEPYRAGAERVRESGCRDVGLRIDSSDLEYLFWWLLRAPQSGIRIESVYFSDRYRPLADPSFRPCAILCTICGDRQRLHGLALAADFGAVDVYLGPGYVADPDG